MSFVSDSDFGSVDDQILGALSPAAVQLETQTDGPEGNPMVLWAVVVYAYLDPDGVKQVGYRRVNSDWFDVAGAAHLLSIAYQRAWELDD
jgi:hypothetical protein